MIICKTIDELRKARFEFSSKTVGFVPTMGALHDGHFSLIELSRKECDATIASIFVNPLQFGPNEDLDKYPRTLEDDLAGLDKLGTDIVFIPEYKTFYSSTHQTWVQNKEVQSLYCGAYRDGHFDGVLTVVSKFFNIVQPDISYFGRKDYQQAFLIAKMVEDLSFPLQVKTGPTIREESGLARSSRNTYLTEEQKRNATALYKGLTIIKQKVEAGATDVNELKKLFHECVEPGGGAVQYIEIASTETLLQQEMVEKGESVVLAAVYYGATRLIDNIEL